MESPDAPELVPETTTGGVDEIPPAFMDKPHHGEENPYMSYDQQDDQQETQPSSYQQHSQVDIWPEYCNPNYVMPDEIEVRVDIGGDQYFFPVSIVKAPANKLYFGGYRNKLNGKVYHHANSQTPPSESQKSKTQKDYTNKRTRETQTVQTKTLSVQLNRESGTQMERIDLKLDNKQDMVRYARTYFTSDELLVRKKAAVISMQRYWRGYRARCVAHGIRQRNIEYKKAIADKDTEERRVDEERRVRDMLRRQHPKTNDDFAVLYNELDAWRRGEVQKIKAAITDPEERQRAMADLLTNETKALQSLQHLKLSAQRELHEEKTTEMLRQMAQPLQWQLSHGETAQVHTPETQRAKYLLELYNALNLEVFTVEQRLDTLLKVKWAVTEANIHTPQAVELKELVDREADLLSRNRPTKSMEKLRLRLRNLFLHFLQNPDFNPRSADFIKEKA